jgi:hypothetical protein
LPSDLITKTQAKFDREFPRGAIASWKDKSDTVYLIPRILVTGQRGLDPEIYLPVFAGSNKTLGPFRVLSLQQVYDKPRAVAAVIDGEDRPLLLSAGVSEAAAAAMAVDRKSFTELAPHGGARVFDGDAPE